MPRILVFGSKEEEVARGWRRLHNEKLLICMLHQILFGWSNQGIEMCRACSTLKSDEKCILYFGW